jgi:glycosyltransferase involved in cell wall biosynthesis
VKVLVVVHQFLPKHAAGSEYYTYYVAKELQRRGHELHLYFTEIDHDRRHAELRTGEYDGLPFHEAVNNHQFPTLRHTWRDEEMEANLERVLDETRPDLVHVQHLHLHSVGYLDLFEERGLPVVYTLHEYVPLCLRHGQLLREGMELCEGPEPEECARCARALNLLPRRVPDGEDLPAEPEEDLRAAVEMRIEAMRSAFAKVDLFVAPSRLLRDTYVRNGLIAPERIVHSDYGFETSRYRPVERTPSDCLRVGFIGTICEWKGVHVLVEAFNRLPEAGIECRIYGELEFMPEYDERVREARRNLAVRFMGRFENACISEILAGLDVLVVPSIWFENSPLTIHEAFLAGVPVLCSDRGGMAELVEDGASGLHFRLGDAGDLARKLQRLLDEPELLGRLRADPARVKSIEDDAEELEGRFRALVAAGRPASAGGAAVD